MVYGTKDTLGMRFRKHTLTYTQNAITPFLLLPPYTHQRYTCMVYAPNIHLYGVRHQRYTWYAISETHTQNATTLFLLLPPYTHQRYTYMVYGTKDTLGMRFRKHTHKMLLHHSYYYHRTLTKNTLVWCTAPKIHLYAISETHTQNATSPFLLLPPYTHQKYTCMRFRKHTHKMLLHHSYYYHRILTKDTLVWCTAPNIHLYGMYVWSSHIARVRINRVRLPILLVVSSTGKMQISPSPFAPENLVPRDGFDSPVPRQPARLHTRAESGAYLRDSSRVPRRRPVRYQRYTCVWRTMSSILFSRLVEGTRSSLATNLREGCVYHGVSFSEDPINPLRRPLTSPESLHHNSDSHNTSLLLHPA